MSNATFGHAKNLLELAANKGVTPEAFNSLFQGGHLADLFEAAVAGTLPPRDQFRATLGLPSLSCLHFHQRIKLGPVAAKKASECFVGSWYYHRDPAFDQHLAKIQPATVACEPTVYQLTRPATFMEMASSLLGRAVSLEEAHHALIAGGHAFTAAQVADLVRRQESGEPLGLNTNGYATLFPVTNADGQTVSVAYVDRGGRWDAFCFSLEDAGRWVAEYRFASRHSGDLDPR